MITSMTPHDEMSQHSVTESDNSAMLLIIMRLAGSCQRTRQVRAVPDPHLDNLAEDQNDEQPRHDRIAEAGEAGNHQRRRESVSRVCWGPGNNNAGNNGYADQRP
ncbi:hypothetical protein [Streptosporangium sp. NBC_01756]|uniref:hypothetical protein n=1 Tax=Streptosporangium sp. NBC_01756 TaxID=2975950 RepID=UPI002DD80E67|nr:hypothetical protein [Streptosporangium sp. NBC_01756]WSC86609.1 hypothetical protein OIE48_40765 [Streptosporangium sp. NBC_01756]